MCAMRTSWFILSRWVLAKKDYGSQNGHNTLSAHTRGLWVERRLFHFPLTGGAWHQIGGNKRQPTCWVEWRKFSISPVVCKTKEGIKLGSLYHTSGFIFFTHPSVVQIASGPTSDRNFVTSASREEPHQYAPLLQNVACLFSRQVTKLSSLELPCMLFRLYVLRRDVHTKWRLDTNKDKI